MKVVSSSDEAPAVCTDPSSDVEPSVLCVEPSEVPAPFVVEALEEDAPPVSVEPSSPLHMHVPSSAVVPVVEIREL